MVQRPMWENRRDEFVHISEKELEKILVDVRDKEDIILTNHSIEKINERPLQFEWIYNSLIAKFPSYVEKQGLNLFKLHYEHPCKVFKDLIIIIAIGKKIIKVVTTYEQRCREKRIKWSSSLKDTKPILTCFI